MKFNSNIYREAPEFSENDIANFTGGKLTSERPSDQNQNASGSGAGGGGGSGAGTGDDKGGAGAAAGDDKNKGAAAAAANSGAAAAANADGGSAAGSDKDKGGAAAAASSATATSEEFDTVDLEATGFKSLDEIKEYRTKYETLEKELVEVRGQMSGRSERARLLNEFANKHEGMEFDAARQYLEIVSLDLSKESDQSLRFRAFQLDEKNKGLTPKELETLFISREQKNFGDPTQDNGQTPVQAIEAKQATAEARAVVEKLQNEYKAASQAEKKPSAEEIAASRADYQKQVIADLSTFTGIQSKVSTTLEDGKKEEAAINFALQPEQLTAVAQAIADPSGWWEGILQEQGILSADGQVNHAKMAELITYFNHKTEISNQIYTQGRNDERIAAAARFRNANGGAGGAGAGNEGHQQQTAKSETESAVAGAMTLIGK